MNRRDFLKTALAWVAYLSIPTISKGDFIPELDWKKWVPSSGDNSQENIILEPSAKKIVENKRKKIVNVQDNTKTVVSDTISFWNWIRELNRSKELIWDDEIDIFMDYFNLNNSNEFVLKVLELQSSNWVVSDWIIWFKTLFMLYENYYIPNKNNFDSNIKQHVEKRENDLIWIKNIKFEMSKYPQKRSNNWVKPKAWWLLKRIDRKIYWDWLSLNKTWTYIDNSLFWNVEFQIADNKNKIFIEDYNWKKVLKVYVNWELEIACYVSPWKFSTKTPRYKRKLPWITDMYHASWNEEYLGAPMPYWVLVDWVIWIYLHWSADIVDWHPRSHGCIRVPLFYQKRLYELVRSGVDFNIDTRYVY